VLYKPSTRIDQSTIKGWCSPCCHAFKDLDRRAKSFLSLLFAPNRRTADFNGGV
jgi:hypothetical protein